MAPPVDAEVRIFGEARRAVNCARLMEEVARLEEEEQRIAARSPEEQREQNHRETYEAQHLRDAFFHGLSGLSHPDAFSSRVRARSGMDAAVNL
jgi:hypothetical protein